MNFIEELIAEWYEYKGYFVRRNVRVGKRVRGGHDGELDIVAFNPITKHLIHIEPSADTDSWEQRERRYRKKFDLGKTHIPKLFEGFKIPKVIEQHAVFMWGSKTQEKLGGGHVHLLIDYFKEIKRELSNKRTSQEIVPENLPLIRTLHLYIDNMKKIDDPCITPLSKPGKRKTTSKLE